MQQFLNNLFLEAASEGSKFRIILSKFVRFKQKFILLIRGRYLTPKFETQLL